jgi:hypothetical protein
VHSLYRCKCSVFYRPYGSDNLIGFPERQVKSVNIKMNWSPDALTQNVQAMGQGATQFVNALSGSTATVVLSDPYLTGASWPVLFDTAVAYTNPGLAAANHIILPVCKEGESPVTDKCRPDRDLELDDQGLRTEQFARFAHILIVLYYEVGGVKFSLDTYFRVQNFSITHGNSYPQVQIMGVDPQTVAFNQTLVNVQFEENQTLEDNLKKIAGDFDHRVSFCNGPDADYSKKYIMPVAFKEKAVTVEEVIKKYVSSVKGDYLKLPLKEFANKISICTRANVNQGCSVFFLGKGLYEGYQLTGRVERDLLNSNAQYQASRGLGIDYEYSELQESEYVLEDIFPTKRKEKLKNAKTSITSFPEQFTTLSKRFSDNQSAGGYVWRNAGPRVKNEKVEKTNLYGIGISGNSPIAFLDGTVVSVSRDAGRVVIRTNYFLQICQATGTGEEKKCTARPIYQETNNLTSLDPQVEEKAPVEMNQQLGTATEEKPEFTRLYIPVNVGSGQNYVTLSPSIVWNFATPAIGLTEEEKKEAGLKSLGPSPSGPAPTPANNVVPTSPKSNSKDWRATDAKKPSKIVIMPGHADAAGTGAPQERELNIELVKWAQRNSASYGISDFLEFYFPPSSNLLVESPLSNISKTEDFARQGKQVIEIHNDGYKPGEYEGKSGVIPPTAGKRIWQLDDLLAQRYGSFPVNHRNGLALPREGGTILEVGRMSPEVINIFTRGTSSQKEALYRQLMDPFMRSVATEKSRAEGSAAPSAPALPSPPDPVIGRVGNTGNSTAPHLHAEFVPPRFIEKGDLDGIITIGGRNPSSWIQTSGFGPRVAPCSGCSSNHKGVDVAGPGDEINNQPIRLVSGTVAEVGSDPGLGNFVVIDTPKGKILLAHLADGSTSGASGAVGSGVGNTSKYGQGVQSGPVPKGVEISTEFRGIPRALRIIPGRTILSFVTKYDEWVENGRPADIDPGVWIAGRFSKWFVKSAEYNWTGGDLRVKLNGISDWGVVTTRTTAPNFEDYLKTEDFKYNDYFGYIRSLGDLCWNLGDGKTSCEELCKEAEELREFLQTSREQEEQNRSQNPSSVTSEYPQANCQYIGTRYPKDRVNAIINAARQGGIGTKAGYAGVVGNAIVESFDRIDPTADNKNPRFIDAQGRGCIGVFQWCDRKAGLDRLAKSLGKPWQDFDVQMQWFVQELKGADFAGPETVRVLNGLSDPREAAYQFGILFERATINRVPGSLQKRKEREDAAEAVFRDLECQ